jgi:ABC-type tungstate transport system permease subunit
MRNLSFVIAFALAQISLASAQDKSIVVASTTSTQDSGLYGFILGQQFIDWLISDEGQKAIANYKINGEQVFWPQHD